jgi:hypothetical protein
VVPAGVVGPTCMCGRASTCSMCSSKWAQGTQQQQVWASRHNMRGRAGVAAWVQQAAGVAVQASGRRASIRTSGR